MSHIHSLRARMTIAVTVAFAILMLGISLGLLALTQHFASRQADRSLALVAGIVQHQGEQRERLQKEDTHRREHPPLTPAEYLDVRHNLLTANHLVGVVLDRHGRVLAQSESPAPQYANAPGWRTRTVLHGTQTLLLGYNWSEFRERLRTQAMMLLILSGCVVLLTAGGAWILVGRTLSPIGHLSHQARETTAASLRLQLTAPSQDQEMVELVSTLNGLLARQAETAAAKGRFYAAASHELRTPLQALSGHLEVALSRERTTEEYRATLQEAHTQTRRLITLVRDLLLLNQLETAATPPARELVCPAELCERILRQLHSLAEERRLQVITTLVDSEILAPPMHAEMLLRNVLENAVKYASLGGEVRVTLDDTPERLRVTVSNSYPEIADWRPERWYEAFSREDPSRNADTGGNGLGLAIAQAIVTANHWQIHLSQHEGITVEIIFPRT